MSTSVLTVKVPGSMAKVTADTTNTRILLIGDSGTGKTRFIGTMPTPFVADFDHGLATLAGKNVSYFQYSGAAGWKEFKLELDTWRTKGPQYGAETFALDSLTMAADAAMQWVLQKNGRANAQPTIADWGEAVREIKDVMAILTTLKCHVIVTAHNQLVKDEVLGGVQWMPLIFGRDLPARLPIYFSEVWGTAIVTTVEQGAKRTEYRLQVKPDAQYKMLKSRLDKTGKQFAMYEVPEFPALIQKVNV